ncbi:MAG TPA: DUF1501 domain-containing protein [Burkholderiaceae bacterium]|nr:DUF1501 domain-containing protein [Burkholderiaceae bacterium]
MSKHMNESRRAFLRASSNLSFLGVAAPFGLNLATLAAASAQTAGTDYKALVCLYFFGGNDSANMVLPTDATSWAEYTRIRTTAEAGSIALPAVGQPGGVLPLNAINNQGRGFALHPALRDFQTLFDAGRGAILSNVGPLIEPIANRTELNTKRRPPKLFSHNDQTSMWQAFAPEGARQGWGGRMGDLLMSTNSKTTFTCISASGNTVFLSGNQALAYQVNSGGAVSIGGVGTTTNNTVYGSAAGGTALRNLISSDRTNLLEKDHNAIVKRSIDAQVDLAAAMLPAGATGIANPTQYTNPNTGNLANNGLAQQFQTVARIIGGRTALGTRRQVFFVGIGGFDTHDFQRNNHADLMARIGHALKYFDDTLAAMPGLGDIRNQVTVFSSSEFGRTYTSNGDGTDHGWGASHFVTGGAVNGRDLYGRFPTIGLTAPDSASGSGAWIPVHSVDQYGATLGRWMGLSETQLDDIFPNLRNFTQRDLGFMRLT